MAQQFGDVPGEGHSGIPKGWMICYIGVILWGIWYIGTNTPELGGWSQSSDYRESVAARVTVEAPAPSENPFRGSEAAIEEGTGLYAANCAVCHGEDLAGGVGPDLTGELAYGAGDTETYSSVFDGRPNGMPGFGDQLGRDRVWKVIAYITSIREEGK